jgi:TniQ
MSTVATQHTGLPFVPQPAPDELLGSWLLRVAQLYGLGLTTLLSRLGARPAGDARLPHWFAVDASTVSLDDLAAATRLPRVDLAALAPPSCRPRWPEELGACESCLADATDAGQPITWNRAWMNPLAVVCSVHGTWLTPVATRTLAGVRHAADFGGIVQQVTAAQAHLNNKPACAGDAQWLQGLCAARTAVSLPWGGSRPYDLIRIVDAVAREVIAASYSGTCPLGLPADRRQGSIKSFSFELGTAERVGVSLPTRLRQRQSVMARVAHVLRWPSEERAHFSSWSAASIKRLASMPNWPERALAWVCPPAAELVRRQDSLRRELSISPRYFKACAALLDSIP